MIAPMREHLPASPPIFELPGPYAPGARIPMVLPLCNLRADIKSDVVVSFLGNAVKLDPERIVVAKADMNKPYNARTTATVLPLNGHREIEVLAEIDIDGQRYTTAPARAPIHVRKKIQLEIAKEADLARITIINAGDASTEVGLAIRGQDLSSDDLQLTAVDDRTMRATFPQRIEAGGEAVVVVRGQVERVAAQSSDGERATASSLALPQAAPVVGEPYLRFGDGAALVQPGDLVAFELGVPNLGSVPILDAQLTLTIDEGLRLLDDTLAVDDVQMVPADRDAAGEEMRLALRRIEPGRTSVLRGAFMVSVRDRREHDVLRVSGLLSAGGATFALDSEIGVDHRPAFSSATTYLGPIEKIHKDRYVVVATITNAELVALQNIHLRWRIEGASPVTALRDGVEVPVRSTTLDQHAAIICDLGELAPKDRTTIALEIAVMPADQAEHRIVVDAALLADAYVIPVGRQECSIEGEPDLRASEFSLVEDRPLRLGLPVQGRLLLRNEGTAPANDVRIALTLPDGISVDLPAAQAGVWRPLCKVLPIGGSIETRVNFSLTRPPMADELRVTAELDADGVNPTPLGTIVVPTPSAPLVNVANFTLAPQPDGHLLALVQIENLGDGDARSVSLKAEDPSLILPGTTCVDQHFIDDVGVRSQLWDGLVLGTLEPGSFREVSWMVAPLTIAPCRQTLRVRFHTLGGEEQSVEHLSNPVRPRIRPMLAPSLPPARRLNERTIEARGIRATVRRLDEPTNTEAALGPALDRSLQLTSGDPAPQAAEAEAFAPPVAQPPAAPLSVDLAPPVPPVAEVPAPIPPAEHASADAGAQGGLDEVPAAAVAEEELSEEELREYFAALEEEAIDAAPEVADEALADPIPEPAAAVAPEPAPVSPEPPPAAAALDEHDHQDDHSGDDNGHQDEAHGTALPVVGRTSSVRGEGSLGRMAGQLRDICEAKGFGWYVHMLAIRMLVAEQAPGNDNVQHVYHELKSLLWESVQSLFPTIYNPRFDISDAWVDDLRRHDADLLQFIELYLAYSAAGDVAIPPAGDGRLDAALARLLPDVVDDHDVANAMSVYKTRLTELLDGYVDVEEYARREAFIVPTATLDEAFADLCDALDRRGAA